MTVCGWLPPCHEGAGGCLSHRQFVFSQFVHEFVCTSARIFTVTVFFQFRDQECPESYSFSYQLHRFLVAVSLISVNHDGRDGSAPDRTLRFLFSLSNGLDTVCSV